MSQRAGRQRAVASPPVDLRRRLGTIGLVASLGALVYLNGFAGPFVADDVVSIVENPNIRSLWPLHRTIEAPPEETAAGRPVVAVSLAVNYAISGLEVWSYRAFNLAVHILTGLVLYGCLRRTFLRLRTAPIAHGLALVVTLLWLVHPLQTESVTYTVQRAESLMALFYLLTLYATIRAADSRRSWRWCALAIAACATGMCAKEVMISAPLFVLLYDRAFLSSGFGEALARRKGLYLGLAGSWLVLLLLLASGARSQTAGLGVTEYTPWEYARTQPGVILHYLRLVVWPSGQCLSYGWPVATSAAEIVPAALVVAALFVASLWAWRSWPGLGLLGTGFFLVLAPTSSVVPIVVMATEHRMYLPLAVVVTVLVVLGARLLAAERTRAGRVRGTAAVAAVILVLGVLTVQRNRDYRSGVALWSDNVQKRPNNALAHRELAKELAHAGDLAGAEAAFREAVRLRPGDFLARYNLGVLLAREGRLDQAADQLREAIRHHPGASSGWPLRPLVAAHDNLGKILTTMGRTEEAAELHRRAIGEYRRAVQKDPENVEARAALGVVLERTGQDAEAVRHYRRALELQPDFLPALNNLTWLLAASREASVRDGAEAVRLGERGATLTAFRDIRYLDALAAAYAESGRFDAAEETVTRALELAADAGQGGGLSAMKRRRALYAQNLPFRRD